MQLFAAIMRCEEADSEVKLIQRDAFVKTDTHASWSAQLPAIFQALKTTHVDHLKVRVDNQASHSA